MAKITKIKRTVIKRTVIKRKVNSNNTTKVRRRKRK